MCSCCQNSAIFSSVLKKSGLTLLLPALSVTSNFDFNARKTQVNSFDLSNKSSAIDVDIDECVLYGKSFCKILRLFLSSKLDCGSHILFIIKTKY